jgi:hypothetical protein
MKTGQGSRSGDFLDFAASDAGSAHFHPARPAIDEGPDGLQIDIPAAFRHVMGVADAVPELRAATTDFTFFGHGRRSPYEPTKHQFSMVLPAIMNVSGVTFGGREQAI